MIVLSCFDGIGGAREALKNLDIDCKYYASEIDPIAIKTAQKNHNDIIQLGNIKAIKKDYIKEPIDLLIGGSPCQDFSRLNTNKRGIHGSKGQLFYEFLRIKKLFNPTFFIYENVLITEKDRNIINEALKIRPQYINSSDFTAQRRARYYWTNIEFQLPSPSPIAIKDILTNDNKINGVCKKREIKISRTTKWIANANHKSLLGRRVYCTKKKSPCLVSSSGKRPKIFIPPNQWRSLNVIECERLQGFRDNYTKGLNLSKSIGLLGNAFTVPVIEFLISAITHKKRQEKIRWKI